MIRRLFYEYPVPVPFVQKGNSSRRKNNHKIPYVMIALMYYYHGIFYISFVSRMIRQRRKGGVSASLLAHLNSRSLTPSVDSRERAGNLSEKIKNHKYKRNVWNTRCPSLILRTLIYCNIYSYVGLGDAVISLSCRQIGYPGPQVFISGVGK